MKVIMYVENADEIELAAMTIKWAVQDNIKTGRNNFRTYQIGNKVCSICKNKESHTVYVKKMAETND